jgi:hypothetical protein
MKNLLFITAHRHVDEISLYADFLNRTTHIKDFDLILHINNLDTDTHRIKESFKLIPNKNKHLILTDKNCDPYGPMQALSDYYNHLIGYDNVIHSHIDVFIADENTLIDKINSKTDKAFLVNHSFKGIDDWMSTDLFIFRPKLLTKDIFKDWVNHFGLPLGGHKIGPCCEQFDCRHVGPCCEQFLYWQIKKNNISYEYIKRFDTDHWDPRRVCMWGCYHEHDLAKARAYIQAI